MTPKVAVERPSTLGEGSLWDATSRCLYWVDIAEHRVFIFDPATGINREHVVGEPVGTVVPAQDGKLVLALRHRIVSLDVATGTLTDVASLEPRDGMRFNDGKCDPAGRLWVGTMVERGEPGTASLYCLHQDLRLEARLGGLSISNGLAWDRAGTQLYYIDTPTRRVDRFDYAVASGALSNRRTVLELPEGRGFPDGMTIDEEDYLWVALWGGGAVVRIHPETGRIVAEVAFPVTNVTSCAFGGPELETLYVTTARAGRSADALQSEPLAGSLFAVNVGVRGVPARRFGRDL